MNEELEVVYCKKYSKKYHLVIEDNTRTYFIEYMPLVHSDIHWSSHHVFSLGRLNCKGAIYSDLMRVVNEYIDNLGDER
tara:strand:+ start:92 stop:328 length:237 start_codon:yes stop_codon:yes gene_type:complete